MGYSREIFDEVQKKLYQMRNESLEEVRRKKEFFYKRFPRAAKIEKKLASTAIEAARAVLSGANSEHELIKLRKENIKLQQELNAILESVNLPINYLQTSYACKKCEDEGFIDGIMCTCMKEMLKKEAYERLNKMSPFELSSFDSFSRDCLTASTEP
mgnify:CR=1 FL=1